MEEVKRAYEPAALDIGKKPPTPTLVTKLILGTFGCVPACDEFFDIGSVQVGPDDLRGFLKARVCPVHLPGSHVQSDSNRPYICHEIFHTSPV